MPSHTLFELLALLSAIAIDALTKTELLPLRPEYRSALKYLTCAETTLSLPFPKATVTLRKMSVKEIRQLRRRIMMIGLALSIKGSQTLTKAGFLPKPGTLVARNRRGGRLRSDRRMRRDLLFLECYHCFWLWRHALTRLVRSWL